MTNSTNQVVKLKDGRKLGFTEYGSPNGKPLFYFHGWPASRLSGQETDLAAKKLGIRVISPDRPGFGLSDYQENRTLLDWPNDIAELADKLKIKKFAVMGCSGGGPYVAVTAYKLPGRVTKAGIVVGIAPTGVKGNLDGVAFRGRIGWANYHRFPFTRTIGTLISLILYKYSPVLGKLFAWPSEEDKKAFLDITKGEPSPTLKESFRQGIVGPRHDLKIYTDPYGFDLNKIKTKVYLWYGEKDQNVSLNMGKYYNNQIPHSELFVDKNGGHLARYYYEEKILIKLIS